MFDGAIFVGLFIALIAGILVYGDAIKRGESQDSAIGWGIFVALILIIGLPLYFIMVVQKPKKEEHITRICPQCGRNLTAFPVDIKNCPYCGKTFFTS